MFTWEEYEWAQVEDLTLERLVTQAYEQNVLADCEEALRKFTTIVTIITQTKNIVCGDGQWSLSWEFEEKC